MLLCDPCHREIDKENPEKYSADDLRAMKREHEEWAQVVLSAGRNSRSHVLQFSATIGTNTTAIPIDECTRAMMPTKTPASATPIEIKVRGAHLADGDPDYWTLEVRNLRRQMEVHQIKHPIEIGEIRHLSVFGLSPMPLLVEFGRLLSDISAVSVFQLHREP
ncbi:MAG: SAVED domain-containing protein [Hyphomicrobiales bacterium]|nr:SAVED domain-containing protein [Hyphomicrobiales bacterium]